MKYLFIDESGSYSRLIGKNDPTNPIFLIAGVIINSKELTLIDKGFSKLKMKYFGTKEITFHASEFANPTKSKQPGISQFTNSDFRRKFYGDLNSLLTKRDFRICGYVVHVEEYLKALVANQPDPYLMGIEIMLDTLIEHLSKDERAKIICESRSNSLLNKAVLNRWEETSNKHGRVGLTSTDKLELHHITKPEFLPKSSKTPGLELVDLIAYQFARGLVSKSPKGPENEIPIELINSKISCYFSLPTHPSYYLNSK